MYVNCMPDSMAGNWNAVIEALNEDEEAEATIFREPLPTEDDCIFDDRPGSNRRTRLRLSFDEVTLFTTKRAYYYLQKYKRASLLSPMPSCGHRDCINPDHQVEIGGVV